METISVRHNVMLHASIATVIQSHYIQIPVQRLRRSGCTNNSKRTTSRILGDYLRVLTRKSRASSTETPNSNLDRRRDGNLVNREYIFFTRAKIKCLDDTWSTSISRAVSGTEPLAYYCTACRSRSPTQRPSVTPSLVMRVPAYRSVAAAPRFPR